MENYRLALGKREIVWGTQLDIRTTAGQTVVTKQPNERYDWNLPSGVYRAQDIVRELDALLEAVLVQLGGAADAEALLANLEANLAITGRESDLPLGEMAQHNRAGEELSRQAQLIGEGLVRWARVFNSQKRAAEAFGNSTLRSLSFRSHCDNHLWTHKVSSLLMGPAGGPGVMQLFNEYLHQIILLRDALLPFDNWEEVPIEVEESHGKGLRFVERSRSEFLAKLLGKKMTHKTIVQYAQSVLSPELDRVGYGFQYRLGTVLPGSLGAELASAPRYLLRWHPVLLVLDGTADGDPSLVAFDYEFPDYYAAPRSRVAGGDSVDALTEVPLPVTSDIREAQLVPVGQSNRVVIQYRLQINGDVYVVDLGQAFRGHRFMYRPAAASDSTSPFQVRVHHPSHILGLEGLVTDEEDTHLIPTAGNPLLEWALLGKLYPENVVVLEGADKEKMAAARNAGKGFGTKFLIV
ncbi:hypothetical protein ABES80_16685 [Bacillus gobiensis]|uniref:hypothetical protein n=1 Tax=Bacillus gobiensis TaxID=1441095 RepID=UPI003D1A547C